MTASTVLAALALLVLAGLDGAFSGFRSSVGRTGLIDHHRSDAEAAQRGLLLILVLLAPVIIAISLDVAWDRARARAYTRAAVGMLWFYGPYALAVLLALAVYAVLHWRLKYLASALILGPGTLIRPAVAVAGGVVGIARSADPIVTVATAWAVLAVLAVEPLADRRWYGRGSRAPVSRRND